MGMTPVIKDEMSTDIKIAQAPPGIEGQGFFATQLEKTIGLARANSLWPLPFATSCCGIEFMATMGSNYDLARFGSERMSFSPRQATNFVRSCVTMAVMIPARCNSLIPMPSRVLNFFNSSPDSE